MKIMEPFVITAELFKNCRAVWAGFWNNQLHYWLETWYNNYIWLFTDWLILHNVFPFLIFSFLFVSLFELSTECSPLWTWCPFYAINLWLPIKKKIITDWLILKLLYDYLNVITLKFKNSFVDRMCVWKNQF